MYTEKDLSLPQSLLRVTLPVQTHQLRLSRRLSLSLMLIRMVIRSLSRVVMYPRTSHLQPHLFGHHHHLNIRAHSPTLNQTSFHRLTLAMPRFLKFTALFFNRKNLYPPTVVQSVPLPSPRMRPSILIQQLGTYTNSCASLALL
jgi:hypothetical protein